MQVASTGEEEASASRNFIFDTLQFPEKTTSTLAPAAEVGGREEELISRLSVEDVEKVKDSGNYTCAPSNARSTSIMVHVVDGESSYF